MACLDGGGYKPAEQIRADAVEHAAYLRMAAAAIIAVDNAARLISNMKLQRDVSDQQMSIAEENQANLKKTFWPRELEFLGEFGTPEDIEEAQVLGRRYAGRLVAAAAGAFAQQIKDADCNASRYCTSQRSKNMQDLLLVRSQAIANARVLGRMIGFSEVQARRDRNDARRRQAVAIGRDLIGQAASFYGAAGRGLAAAGGEISKGLNSALQAFGAARYDPGISSEMQGMLAQAQFSGGARMPYQAPSTNYSQFGSIDALMNADPAYAAEGFIGGDPTLLGINVTTNPHSTWSGLQNERWNEADVGNRNLARVGSKTYSFTDSRGDRGSITVNMSDFQLQFVDEKNPGDS